MKDWREGSDILVGYGEPKPVISNVKLQLQGGQDNINTVYYIAGNTVVLHLK